MIYSDIDYFLKLLYIRIYNLNCNVLIFCSVLAIFIDLVLLLKSELINKSSILVNLKK